MTSELQCNCADGVVFSDPDFWGPYEHESGNYFYYGNAREEVRFLHYCHRRLALKMRELLNESPSAQTLYDLKDDLFTIFGAKIFLFSGINYFFWDENENRVQNTSNSRRFMNIDIIGKEKLHFDLLENN